MDVNAYKASEAHLYQWLGFAATDPDIPPDPDPDPLPEVTRAEFDALSARMTATESDLETLKGMYINHTHGKPA